MVKIVPVTVTLSLTVTEILATISIHPLTHPLKQHLESLMDSISIVC